MKKEKAKPRTDEENIQFIDDSVTIVDEQRLAGLKEFKRQQSIEDIVMKHDMKRLIAKHGADHPRVKEIESQLEFNEGMAKGVESEIQKASIRQEPFDSDSWRVHGRVFDRNKKMVKGVTVYLSNGNRQWIKEFGSSCTDELGYYSLTLSDKQIKEAEKQKLFLSASDKNKKNIYSDTEALTPVAGIIKLNDIYLGGDECTSPPDDNSIR